MSMLEKSLACPDGVIDVGIVVPSCFENPLKEESIKFIEGVLTQRKKALLPLTTIMGAYHIATRYLKVPKVATKKILAGIVESGSRALYPQITPENASDGLDFASAYGIESWDGYLMAVAKSVGATLIYSLDSKLARVNEVKVVSPFTQEAMGEYYKFLKSKGL